MKGLPRVIAMTALAGALISGAPAQAGGDCSAPAALAWPDFCAIPPIPGDTPTAAAIRARVLAVHMAGAEVERLSTPETFTLSGTGAFEAHALAHVRPPPPMIPPGQADTAAFAEEARKRATPPPKPR